MDKLGINLGFLIAQIVNFGILFLLLSKLVWPRMLVMLDERQERIAKGLEDARSARQERENAEREGERILAQARIEGQRLRDEMRRRGEEQGEQARRLAQRETENFRSQARIQAEEERNRILADARGQIISLAMAAAEELIGDGLDTERQRVVLKKFFAGVPEGAEGIGEVVVAISAVPLLDDEIDQVKQVTGAKVVENKVEPNILGGLVLRAGDKVVDGSVRGDLTALSAQLH
ncbi:MAG: F0F1 ATP synthase subunit B [Anaerolineae bacterium]|nr:F0F1 ATP synthase subunit B [Anaerolineae bacterium]